ncbi:MAG: exosortase family protein XrtF [Bacteroidia bacterium]
MPLTKILQENKKVLFFLLRFLGAFGGLSLLYAFWVDSYGNEADAFSWMVGRHLQWVFGAENLLLTPMDGQALINMDYLGISGVDLYEGCNGMAIMILFFAFVFAYTGSWKDLLWFVPLGLFVIHVFNLIRIALLILFLEGGNEIMFHYMHKYFFTLIIYGAVFFLWVFWVKLANKRNTDAPAKV